MEPITQQEIQKRFGELPKDVQEAIQSNDVAERIRAIGTRNHLHVDKLGGLEDETLTVMLGFAEPAGYAKRIAAACSVDEQTAAAIADEISKEIFMPIRASMQQFMDAGKASVVESHPPIPPATPEKGTAVQLSKTDEKLLTPSVSKTAPVTINLPSTPATNTQTRVDPYREPIA